MSYPKNDTKNWNPFGIEIWIAWLGATAVGVAGMTTFFYMNFQTKESFAEYKSERIRSEEEMSKRLEHIEAKLDRLLENHKR